MIFNIAISNLRLNDVETADLQEMSRYAADELRDCFQEHFRGLPSKDFWQDAAVNTTRQDAGGNQVVAIRKAGVALQRWGGTVKAGKNKSPITGEPTKWLAIPVAKGMKRPFMYKSEIVFIKSKKPGLALLKTKPKAKGDKGEVMFWLKKETHHKPHPEVFPTGDAQHNAVRQGVNDYLELLSFLEP